VLILERKPVTAADSARADSLRADSARVDTARARPDSLPPPVRDSLVPPRDTVPPEPVRRRFRLAALPPTRR